MSRHEHHHHGQHHSHHDHQTSDSQGNPSEEDKLLKIVEHWIHHNDDHAGSYRDWAAKARNMGREDIYLILEEVAGSTQVQNEKFQKVLELLKQKPQAR